MSRIAQVKTVQATKATAEAVVENTEVLRQLLAAQERTNHLLEMLVAAGR